MDDANRVGAESRAESECSGDDSQEKRRPKQSTLPNRKSLFEENEAEADTGLDERNS